MATVSTETKKKKLGFGISTLQCPDAFQKSRSMHKQKSQVSTTLNLISSVGIKISDV